MEFLRHVLYVVVTLSAGAALWHWRVQVKATIGSLYARMKG